MQLKGEPMPRKKLNKEDRLEEKVSPGIHKRIKKIAKKKHKKLTHKVEHSLEEKLSPGIHKKVSKLEKPARKSKVKIVMDEFKAGKLHSGSKKGKKVTNPKQAIAIALSESRKVGKKKKK